MSVAELQLLEEEIHMLRQSVTEWQDYYGTMSAQCAIHERELTHLREEVQVALDELRHDPANQGAIWRLRRLVARLPQQ